MADNSSINYLLHFLPGGKKRPMGIGSLSNVCYVSRTKEAMKGSMNFREALAMRLNIIKPSVSQIKSFLLNEPARLSPRIK